MKLNESNDLLTVQEVAAYLSLSALTVYRQIKQGRIPVKRMGKSIRVSKVELDEALRAKA